MIELPYPHKALWPNGRPHHMAKAREIKKHRAWAYAATLADNTRPGAVKRLVITVCPKPRGPIPDEDNVSAAVKSYQDGIADAYRIDDRTMGQPRVQFAERCADGKFIIDFEDTFQSFGDVAARVVADLARGIEQ